MHLFIDEITDSCRGGNIKSVTPPGICNLPTESITPENKAQIFVPIATFVLILLAVITILVIVIVVQRKRWKKQKQAFNNIVDNTYSNLAHNGEL
jgi:hypothetical protein